MATSVGNTPAATTPTTTAATGASTTNAASTINEAESLLGALTGAATGGGATATGAAGATTAAGTSAEATLTKPALTLNTSTLADAVTSIANYASSRQSYLAAVSGVITEAADKSGQLDQGAVANLNIQLDNNKAISDMAKKIEDTLQQTISTWTNPNG